MTRAQALAWLKLEFAAAIADLAWVFAPANGQGVYPEGNFGVVIDNALRALGVAEADLATYVVLQDDVADFLLLLNYYALRLIVKGFAVRVDIRADDPVTEAKRSQAAAAYRNLLKDAKDEVKDLLKPGMEYGNLVLDIYEPTPLS